MPWPPRTLAKYRVGTTGTAADPRAHGCTLPQTPAPITVPLDLLGLVRGRHRAASRCPQPTSWVVERLLELSVPGCNMSGGLTGSTPATCPPPPAPTSHTDSPLQPTSGSARASQVSEKMFSIPAADRGRKYPEVNHPKVANEARCHPRPLLPTVYNFLGFVGRCGVVPGVACVGTSG